MIGVIGTGAMGSALLEGLLSAGHDPATLQLVDLDASKLASFEARGLQTSTDVTTVARADWVVVAVKPHHVMGAIAPLKGLLAKSTVILSIAAGVSTGSIERLLGEVAVVRAMPNTPALVGLGMTGVAAGAFVSDANIEGACEILGAVGKVAVVEESDLDALTAVSGSGPAYLFYLAEALVEGAIEQGLDAELADQLVRQTMWGAGALLAQGDDDAVELRRKVTSPGGTTQAAVEEFDAHSMKSTIIRAVDAATRRSRQMRSDS